MFAVPLQNAINTCLQHVQSLPDDDSASPELEAYLVAGVVLLIVSEYEALIESMFQKRADKCNDPHISSYVRAMIAQKFRSPDLSKITDTLARFGQDYKETFNSRMLNTESHMAWDNIMKARHAVVHRKGTLNLTLHELNNTFPKTLSIIVELETVLGI
ncbi:MAG: hypothetical protein HQK59_00125 [Deltaproteobacteria bacterium]|nr:hypothetical protein [Deltaproteobacteria bacterium]